MQAVCPLLLLLALACGCDPRTEDPFLRESPSPWLLHALNQPPLGPLATQKTNHLYRLICEPSFHPPFCIVLQIAPDGSGAITGTLLRNHKEIAEQHQNTVDPATAQKFIALVNQSGFWKMDPGQKMSETGLDGSQWHLEALHDGQYHLVSRWSPRHDTPVGLIGRRLLQLADWKMENIY